MGLVSWEQETGHARLTGTLHKKMGGGVAPTKSQLKPSSVPCEGKSVAVAPGGGLGRIARVAYPLGERKSPLSGGEGLDVRRKSVSAQWQR